MATVGEDIIETAALGRPFQLGMLYDCRKDAIVPGITLYNQLSVLLNIGLFHVMSLNDHATIFMTGTFWKY